MLSSASDENLGTLHFDIKLFENLAPKAEDPKPGSKRGVRLLLGCERIRKLLSQLADASVVVENCKEDGDASFKMSRQDFASLSQPLLDRLKVLVEDSLNSSKLTSQDINCVELVGGGSRMLIVHQEVVFKVFGHDITLNTKLDDTAISLGAALLHKSATESTSVSGGSTDETVDAGTTEEEPVKTDATAPEVDADEESIGLSPEELSAAIALEVSMKENDSAERRKSEIRNSIEATIFKVFTLLRLLCPLVIIYTFSVHAVN